MVVISKVMPMILVDCY